MDNNLLESILLKDKTYKCPTCFQENNIQVELSYGSELVEIIEDCTICCNPNSISYNVEDNEINMFEVEKTY